MPDAAAVTAQDVWSARLLRSINDQDGKPTSADVVALAEMDVEKVGRHLRSVPESREDADWYENDVPYEDEPPAEVGEVGLHEEPTVLSVPDPDVEGPITDYEAQALAVLVASHENKESDAGSPFVRARTNWARRVAQLRRGATADAERHSTLPGFSLTFRDFTLAYDEDHKPHNLRIIFASSATTAPTATELSKLPRELLEEALRLKGSEDESRIRIDFEEVPSPSRER